MRAPVFVFLFSCLFAAVSASAQDLEAEADPVRDRMRQAEILFRFAMLERGSVNFMRDAKILVDEAEEELQSGKYDQATKTALGKELAGLRADLWTEDEIAESTFYGAFPLVRFVKGSYLSNPQLIGRYEFLKRPDRNASAEAIGLMLKSIGPAQCDVIILTDPMNQDLEREYLVQMGRQPNFFVRTARQLSVRISDEDLRNIYPPTGEAPIPAELFGNRPLLFVWIRQLEAVDNCYHYVVEAHLFSAAGAAATKVVTTNGYCIDRREVFPIILALHVVLLIAAPFIYRELARRTSHSKRPPEWINTFALGVGGFVWGRIIVWGLAPLLAKSEPDPASSLYLSFWWPALFGPFFILGPATVMRFAETRFKALGAAFVMYNRWGPLFCIVALGSATYLIQASLHYDGLKAAGMIVPLLVGAPLAAYVVGRSLDKADTVPLGAGAAATASTLAYGLAWCAGSAVWLWVSLLPVLAAFGAAFVPKEKWAALLPGKEEPARSPAEGEPIDESIEKARDPDAETLTTLASDPPFHETTGFASARDAMQSWFDGRFTVVGLHGLAGWGKSKTLASLLQHVEQQKDDAKVLYACCAEPTEGTTQEPFRPFQEAIAGHFAINLLAPQKDEIKYIDKALGGVFDSVVPFAPLLFPAAKAGTQPGSRQEMFLAIATMMKQLASRTPVLLVIDDTHWMDPASRELLEFLVEELNEDPDCGVGILIAGREAADVTDKGEISHLVPITPMSRDEMQVVLHKGLMLHEETAETLLASIGGESRNLFWLFQIVVHLAQQDIFVWRNGGFGLREGIEPLGHYLPDDYRQSLETLLNKHPDFVPILTCAACIGLEFHVDRLAKGVDIPRLLLLQKLHQIEAETGIIRDLMNKDDVFAFQSSFMLEMLRRILDVRAEGPQSPVAPQIIREFHYRLGTASEKAAEDSNSLIYAVASHYYAAGATHGAQGMSTCMTAARAASDQFQHETARRFLEMAVECAESAGLRDRDFERERLLLECRAAHVEGKGRVEIAQRCLDYLQEYSDASFRVYQAAAQACYDAALDTRDQSYFQETVRLAEEMLERFDEPFHQAEARHFWGIALPPTEATDRRLHLRFAMALVDGETSVDEDGDVSFDAMRLKSKVANSLAEQLSRGSDEDKAEAKRLFELSIEIDSREETWSAEGLAYSHGGLGRLYYFAEEPDLEKARHHFAEDLKYSIKTGSRVGQTKMNSLMAACDLKLADRDGGTDHLESALHCYRQARRFSDSPFDSYFALAGILECLGRLDRLDEADEFGNELAQLARSAVADLSDEDRKENPVSAIPGFCVPAVESALRQCQKPDSDWHHWLSQLVIENRTD